MADLISEETVTKTFSDMQMLEPWLQRQLKKLKIEKPTPIQFHCIPEALKGRDIIGAAKTGSGKTLAFVIPILQKLSVDPYGIYTLVLTPTRELAFQIADQFKGLGTPLSLKLCVVVGGFDKVSQGAELSRTPHIVVATPGRLADILQTSPEFTLKRIKFLVLDEADRLMDGRFDAQLKVIWEALPLKRQTLLFSATITDRLQNMKELARSDVFHWESQASQATVQQLVEHYALVNPAVKDATLVSILLRFKEASPKGLVLIFTDTCKNAQILKMMLNELDIGALCLHSMMKQKERLAALSGFKSSRVKFLIATDLASRGLDIPLVQMVINHDIPNLPKTYIHRVGRTARAGRPGTAVTLITPVDIKLLLATEATTKRKMTEFKVDGDHVKKILREVNITRREQQIILEETDFEERRTINKRKRLIMEGKDPDEVERELEKKKKITKRKKEVGRSERILLAKTESSNINDTTGTRENIKQRQKIKMK